VIQPVNIGKVFFALDQIDRLNAGKDEQYSGRYGNAPHSESGKIFHRLKQGGVNGSAVAFFELKQATVMIAVAVILHRLGWQMELFVKQFLGCFFGRNGHCKAETATDIKSNTLSEEKKRETQSYDCGSVVSRYNGHSCTAP